MNGWSGERKQAELRDRRLGRPSYAFVAMLKSLNIIFQVRETIVFKQKDCSINVNFWFLFVCLLQNISRVEMWIMECSMKQRHLFGGQKNSESKTDRGLELDPLAAQEERKGQTRYI